MTEEEFKKAVMPHHQLMMAEALHILQNRDDALDCLQDAITALWKSRKTLLSVGNIRAYCIKTVSNRAIEMLRRQVRTEDESNDNMISDDPPDAALERAEKMALLKKAVKLLPENERMVIVMKVLKGMSGEEIAETTGLSHANVRVLTHRARQRLKEYLEKHKGI
ncbi:MAG: sigma-70 family RNA polymerase sigma factor [Muribaculum sp.]|nr:sigma-70 family RNA polymerase sigma factor [Muribaculum sp.]